MNDVCEVTVSLDSSGRGLISVNRESIAEPIWKRISSAILEHNFNHKSSMNSFRLSWPDTLTLVREFGTRSAQQAFGFKLVPSDQAKEKLVEFAEQVRSVRQSRNVIPANPKSADELKLELIEKGFVRRTLKDFQIRDLLHLLALSNGANFSVPGAGKTTVTFALHLLFQQPGQHFHQEQ